SESRESEDIADDDAVFKAIASPVRRTMLDILKEAPRTTGELCGRLPQLDRTTVLQHLRVLERAGLVTGKKRGRERHLTLAPLPIQRIHDRWISDYMRSAVTLLERLGEADEPESAHLPEHLNGPRVIERHGDRSRATFHGDQWQAE